MFSVRSAVLPILQYSHNIYDFLYIIFFLMAFIAFVSIPLLNITQLYSFKSLQYSFLQFYPKSLFFNPFTLQNPHTANRLFFFYGLVDT